MSSKKKLVKVRVLIGSLSLEDPPGAKKFSQSKTYSKGEIFNCPLWRAEKIDPNSAEIIRKEPEPVFVEEPSKKLETIIIPEETKKSEKEKTPKPDKTDKDSEEKLEIKEPEKTGTEKSSALTDPSTALELTVKEDD